MTADATATEVSRVMILVSGHVQGVGFRWWTRSRALELGLAGFARNLDNGKVEIEAQGPQGQVDQLVRLVREQPTTSGRPGRVDPYVPVTAKRPRDDLHGFVEL